MKNRLFGMVLASLVMVSFISCVSLQDREMTTQERYDANIVGTVEVRFTSFQPFHVPGKNSLKRKANAELMREARKKYQGNIEIKNIDITGSLSGWQIPWSIGSVLIGFLVPAFFPDYQYSEWDDELDEYVTKSQSDYGFYLGMIGAPFMGTINFCPAFSSCAAISLILHNIL